MAEYTELIKALRWCADESICCDDFSGEKCPYYDVRKDSCSVDDILHDAADAIEELQAEVKILKVSGREAYFEGLAAEPKRGEWIETEEKEWCIYPFKKQTCSVCDCKIDHIFMLACMDYFDDGDTVFHYCPNCGAKMEAQDGE